MDQAAEAYGFTHHVKTSAATRERPAMQRLLKLRPDGQAQLQFCGFLEERGDPVSTKN